LFILVDFERNHIHDVASINSARIPYSFNSLVGLHFQEYVYSLAFSRNAIKGYVALDEKSSKVIGYIIWALDLKQLKKCVFYAAFNPKFFWRICRLLCHLSTFKTILDIVSVGKIYDKYDGEICYLVSIAVDCVDFPVGSELMNSFISTQEIVKRVIYLDFRKTNVQAFNFYKKFNFEVVASTKFSYLLRRS
jgi:ribosomal protein S18 acetylase RimI-like enzyme